MPTTDIEPWARHLAPRADLMRASEIRELLKLLDQPDIISFAGGIPDPDLFPLEAAKRAAAKLLDGASSAVQALQYAPSEGYLPLREWIVQHMASDGVDCNVENILLTTGSQQALDLIAKLLVGKGEKLAVTSPTYLGALQAFRAYEPELIELLPSRPEAIDEDATLAYIVPDFANPTGETLLLEQRQSLVELSASRQLPLIEDAAYRSLRFDGPDLPSCLAIDCQTHGSIEDSFVLYCGTFSKTLSPGLRVGWICAASSIIQKLVLAKQASDLHSAPLTQMIACDLASNGFGEQVSKNIAAYRQKRDAMHSALKSHMPDGVHWTKPQGGMFFWLSLPEALDGRDLLSKAIEQERVAFVPGSAFFADGSGLNTIRLNFSMNDAPKIEEGIKRIARLIQAEVNTSR